MMPHHLKMIPKVACDSAVPLVRHYVRHRQGIIQYMPNGIGNILHSLGRIAFQNPDQIGGGCAA
jgi:hypothetical protein